jgi:hypothetical protein
MRNLEKQSSEKLVVERGLAGRAGTMLAIAPSTPPHSPPPEGPPEANADALSRQTPPHFSRENTANDSISSKLPRRED